MHRRHFIETAAVGALGLAGGLGFAPRPTSLAPEIGFLARPGLLALLKDEQVRSIGRRYIERYWSADVRLEALALGLPDEPGRLENQVRNDFSAGRTVILNGWVLSVTEARQCALFSLLHP